MDVLARNKKFHNKYKNKECYIFGNGASIKYTDLADFRDKYSIVCTWMFLHKDFNKLNVVADYTLHPYYFGPMYRNPFTRKISLAKSGKEMINLGRFNYKHPVFVCETNKRFLKKENIFYIKFKKGSNYNQNKFLLHEEFTMSQNSLYAGIGIAQYFGFKKVNLVGFDYITENSINGHFYEKSIGWEANKALQDLDANFVKVIKKNLDIQNISVNNKKTIFFKNKIYKNPSYKENNKIVKNEYLSKINKLNLGYNIYFSQKKPLYFQKYKYFENNLIIKHYFKILFKSFRNLKNLRLKSFLWRVLFLSYKILSNSKKLIYFNFIIKSFVSKYNVNLFWHCNHYYNPSVMNWDYLYIIYKNISKMTRLVKKNKNHIALDIGASVGSNAMVMSRYFKNVFAFEPSRDCGFILNKNIKENKIKNIKFFEIALLDFDGFDYLSNPNQSGLFQKYAYGSRGLLFKNKKNFEKISVRNANLFLEKKFKKNQFFDFIKLDCEGSEFLILKNLYEKLKYIGVLQIEHNFSASNYKLDEITKYLFNSDFKCIYYSSNTFNLKKPIKEFEGQSIEIFAFNRKIFKISEIDEFINKNNIMLKKMIK
tara:strand:+ start:13395 stop:15179 length:1785 start_codon:yes stop_codon:yes gene_type:complete